MAKVRTTYFLVLAALLTLFSCSSLAPEDEADGAVDDRQASRELTSEQFEFSLALSELEGTISDAREIDSPEQISKVTNSRTGVSGGTFKTITTRYRHSPGFQEYFVFDPSTTVIYPGALLRGDSIASGAYIPIRGKRGSATISTSLQGLGEVSARVGNVSLSSVREAINGLLSQKQAGRTGANILYSMERVYSRSHVKAVVGGNLGSGVDRVAGQFDFSNTSQQTKILVRFRQVYYTIDLDQPPDPSEFFAPDADWLEISSQVFGTLPVYVSSVSYGRMVFCAFESSTNYTALSSAIKASLNDLKKSGLTVDHTNQAIINNASVRAIIVGGSELQAVEAITGGMNGLRNYLVTGGEYSRESPGVAISYQLRYLHNYGVARVVFSSEYEIQNTTYTAPAPVNHDVNFRVEVKVTCNGVDDGWSPWGGYAEELYGDIRVTAYRRNHLVREAIRGSIDGIADISKGLIWSIPVKQGVNWQFDTGTTKRIPTAMVFTFDKRRRADTFIKVEAELREQDFLGSHDYLGKHSKTVALSAYYNSRTIRTYTLPRFTDGGTSFTVQFTVQPN